MLADKTLLVAVADDHNGERAQQLSSHMGKVLRINLDGSVPKDNPFLRIEEALPEIWSIGHRVPLGFYQDQDSGLVWEVESGPRGGDELNLLRAGNNYGWAIAGWGFSYQNGGLETPHQTAPGVQDPILVWMPSVTPSGLARYRGKMYPQWDGDYFAGQLSGKSLLRLRIDNERVVLQERILVDLEERIRDVKVGPDNHIYILTDHEHGRLLRLRTGRPRGSELGRIARKLNQTWLSKAAYDFPDDGEEQIATMEPSSIQAGKLAFLERCAACHCIGDKVLGGKIGPDLDGIYGRQMGRVKGYSYSPNLSGAVHTWNFATLNRFLADPERMIPRTKMVSPPVIDPSTRRNIIGFLKEQTLQ